MTRGAHRRRRADPDPLRSLARLRQRRRRLGRWTLLLGALVCLVVLGPALLAGGDDDAADAADVSLVQREGAWVADEPGSLTPVDVVEVIDGDTIDVRAGGTELRVRLFGVDAAERREPCFDEAAARLRRLAGDEVLLLADERQQDSFGRELRYVFTADGHSIDAALIGEGVAFAWRDDGRFRDTLVRLEEEAEAAGTGCLWGGG